MEDCLQDTGGSLRMTGYTIRVIECSKYLHACDELAFLAFYWEVCDSIL